MALFASVQEVISSTLKIPAEMVQQQTSADDLAAWDSLAHINLMIALEEAFDLQMEVEDFATLNSVPAILAYLEKQGRR
jgi:acyl carrier protein